MTLVAYAPAIRAGFVWDDDAYVTANRTLRTLDGLRRIWFEPGAVSQYYPLVFTGYWLEYRLWGLQPMGYHVVNVLLHALGAVLLWRVLLRLDVPGAWLAAALFALHPVHVESVAWVTERKNVLSGVFYLGTALAYLRFAADSLPQAMGATRSTHRRWRWYGLALVLFVGALLSKTVTCSLPAALLLVLWWTRERITRRDVLPLVPLFITGAALALLTIRLEKVHVGATGADWDLSLLARCLIAGRALWFYAGKLAWPAALTFVYPRWDIDPQVWWQYLFPIAALAVVAALYGYRRQLGSGPLVAVLFFAGTLFPALGFIDVFPMRYSFVADHFQYHASIGLITLAAAAATVAVRRAGPAVYRARALSAGGVLLLFAVLVWRQGAAYQDLRALWTDTLAKNPGAWMAHNNLGLLLSEEGRDAEAMAHYQEALRVKPDDAYAHNNIGNLLVGQGDREGAIHYFQEALRIDPTNAESHSNLGNIFASQGDFSQAMAHYGEAVRIKPKYADAHNNLANVLALQGRTDEAIHHYQQALAADPDYAAAHHNLGVMLATQGGADDAIAEYRQALALQPDYADAHVSLAMALAALGRADEARSHLAEALRLRPGDTNARALLESLREERE